MIRAIVILVLFSNIGFSQESQYSFYDLDKNEIRDFQIAIFLNQNITLKYSQKHEITLEKADIVASDSISLLIKNNLSIRLKKEAFENKNIMVDFSIKLDAIEISNHTKSLEIGKGRIAPLTFNSSKSSTGRLVRIALDSLQVSNIISIDLCFVRSKESKNQNVTIVYYYSNEVNDLDVKRCKKNLVLNFEQRKHWFNISMSDLKNENNYKYLYVGYIIHGNSEVKVGEWKANNKSFIKEYWLRYSTENYNQWHDNIKRYTDKIKYPAIRLNFRN